MSPVYEHLLLELFHRDELLREAERMRLAAQASPPRRPVHRSAGRLLRRLARFLWHAVRPVRGSAVGTGIVARRAR